jgi:hypothetical protein
LRTGLGVRRRFTDPEVLRTGCITRLTGLGKNPRKKLTDSSFVSVASNSSRCATIVTGGCFSRRGNHDRGALACARFVVAGTFAFHRRQKDSTRERRSVPLELVRASTTPRGATRIALLSGLVAWSGLTAAACGTSPKVPVSERSPSPPASTTRRPASITTTPTPTAATPSTGRGSHASLDNLRYETIAALSDDSAFVVIGRLRAENADLGGYPMEVVQSLGTTEPRIPIGVTTHEFTAANLSVGGTYVFFYGIDPIDKTTCIVGGVRGVFAFDPASQSVTRLDADANSEIPASQTLVQFERSLAAAERQAFSQPVGASKPVCAPSATGLAS